LVLLALTLSQALSLAQYFKYKFIVNTNKNDKTMNILNSKFLVIFSIRHKDHEVPNDTRFFYYTTEAKYLAEAHP
jgi:hypothetical protein